MRAGARTTEGTLRAGARTQPSRTVRPYAPTACPPGGCLAGQVDADLAVSAREPVYRHGDVLQEAMRHACRPGVLVKRVLLPTLRPVKPPRRSTRHLRSLREVTLPRGGSDRESEAAEWGGVRWVGGVATRRLKLKGWEGWQWEGRACDGRVQACWVHPGQPRLAHRTVKWVEWVELSGLSGRGLR
eukprot:1187852-Prorocentrum_minimum.AAC.7